jgi:hypothetical protein
MELREAFTLRQTDEIIQNTQTSRTDPGCVRDNLPGALTEILCFQSAVFSALKFRFKFFIDNQSVAEVR